MHQSFPYNCKSGTSLFSILNRKPKKKKYQCSKAWLYSIPAQHMLIRTLQNLSAWHSFNPISLFKALCIGIR